MSITTDDVSKSTKGMRVCEKHGEYEAWRYGGDRWTLCDQCEAEAEQAARIVEASVREQKRLDDAGVPVRFRQATFENYRTGCPGQSRALMMARSYAENFIEHRAAGRCLMLMGFVGTGKTHLSISIGKCIMEKKFTVRYITVMELIQAIRETWRNDSQFSELDVIRRYASCDLLILDEVGVQYGKESEQVDIFKVLNKRYNDMLPSILISNCSPTELKQFIGERAYDRLRENDGKSVVFDWASERE